MVCFTELSSDIIVNNIMYAFKGINCSRDLKPKLYLFCSFQVSSNQFLYCVDEAKKKVQCKISRCMMRPFSHCCCYRIGADFFHLR